MVDAEIVKLVQIIGSEMRAIGATHCRLESGNTKIELSLASDPAQLFQAPTDELPDYSEEKRLPRPSECHACQKRPIGGSSLCKANKLCRDCNRARMSGAGKFGQ